LGDRLAQNDVAQPNTIRSNKQSVYERGVEPSGNAHQYPFAASAQRPTATQENADLGQSSSSSGERAIASPAADRAGSTGANRRQIVLEWSRDGSHARRDRPQTSDASR
jgi:hypothetical protein